MSQGDSDLLSSIFDGHPRGFDKTHVSFFNHYFPKKKFAIFKGQTVNKIRGMNKHAMKKISFELINYTIDDNFSKFFRWQHCPNVANPINPICNNYLYLFQILPLFVHFIHFIHIYYTSHHFNCHFLVFAPFAFLSLNFENKNIEIVC